MSERLRTGWEVLPELSEVPSIASPGSAKRTEMSLTDSKSASRRSLTWGIGTRRMGKLHRARSELG